MKDRFRYWFDNLMARGAGALIVWLMLLTSAVVLLLAVVLYITHTVPPGSEQTSFAHLVWITFTRAIDTGAISGDTGDVLFLAAMLIATFCGIFILSALIGIINSGIERKIEALRKGRSRVLEQDHVIILGWSPRVFTVIGELIAARDDGARTTIAILADRDKVEMEDAFRAKLSLPKHVRLICRTGNVIDPADLHIVNPDAARAIIILPEEEGDPDIHAIKTILALVNNPRRGRRDYHIVASLHDAKNLDVARLAGRDEARFILGDDLIARITAQACRQSGLSVVYTELLDFDGDEIYFAVMDSLTGRTFAEAMYAFEKSAVMGVCTRGGEVLLHPAFDRVLEPGDAVIAISENRDSLRVGGARAPKQRVLPVSTAVMPEAERTLVLGWNAKGPRLLLELDRYVAKGSTCDILTLDTDAAARIQAMQQEFGVLAATVREMDTTDRTVLEHCDPARYDHIILLSEGTGGVQESDARTLVTLLHLRDILKDTERKPSIVSEMLDVRNRALAEIAEADDFIVTNHLDSLLVTQICENRHLYELFNDLFDADGYEIYLKPAELYIEPGAEADFYDVLDAAMARNEIALGYRLARHSGDGARQYGVVLNPLKREKISFQHGDKVILLAED